MFIQVNETISLAVSDIICILDKECLGLELAKLKNVEIVEYIDKNEEDIKTYIITKDEDLDDKTGAYKLYKSAKSSLSLINRFNKLEEYDDGTIE